MMRLSLCLFALIACTFCVTGCGNNSPKFDETKVQAQTPEEIQEAEDYSKMLEEQNKQYQ